MPQRAAVRHPHAAFDSVATTIASGLLSTANDHSLHAVENFLRQPSSAPKLNAADPHAYAQSADHASRIAIKANGRIFLIDPTEIIVAEAHGNYVLLEQRKASHMLREQISTLANKLRPYGLIRIHRSVVVNAAHVEQIRPLMTGEYRLRMKSGKEYKVTRTYKKNLQCLATAWIGTETFSAD